jgi:hypothetical protein
MAKNRKAAEAEIIRIVTLLEGGNHNATLYGKVFARITDDEFDAWMGRMEREEEYLSIIVPNFSDIKLTTERSMAVGESLGVRYFQHIRMTDSLTGEEFLTPVEYLVVDMAVRRQSQHLIKKQSIAENDKVIDHLSGQVTGDSKGGKISLPELLALESKGFDQSLIEMIKVRGGDDEALRAAKESIRRTGGYSLGPILKLNTLPKSTEVLRALLLSAHIDNTIGKQRRTV